MNPNLRFTTLFAMFCCFFAAIAGEEHDQFPDTVLNINEVAVVARRQPLASAQSISGVELQKLSSTSIADALKYFAGVQIKDYGGLGGLKTINVRSLGAQHVGVYIDGVRLTNAQNGTIDLGKYSLSTLESVSLFNANRLDQCQSASEYASVASIRRRLQPCNSTGKVPGWRLLRSISIIKITPSIVPAPPNLSARSPRRSPSAISGADCRHVCGTNKSSARQR